MMDLHDRKGLIREAFRIDGISAPECRSIFLDWALSVPEGIDSQLAVQALLSHYASEPDDHPMKDTLRAALVDHGPAKRRGGRSGRFAV
jgi:hypothetical protein